MTIRHLVRQAEPFFTFKHFHVRILRSFLNAS